MSDDDLSPTARIIYFFIREFAKPDGFCEASYSELAARAGITEALCSVYISDLVRAGYVVKARGIGLGSGRKRLGIVGLVMTLFASATIGAADPASGSSGSSLASQQANPAALYYQDLEKPARKRRRRSRPAAA